MIILVPIDCGRGLLHRPVALLVDLTIGRKLAKDLRERSGIDEQLS